MDDTDPQWGMTDLEERLRGPDGSAETSKLVSRLSQLAEQLDVMTTRGLRPGDFDRANAMKAAVVSAQQILTAMSR